MQRSLLETVRTCLARPTLATLALSAILAAAPAGAQDGGETPAPAPEKSADPPASPAEPVKAPRKVDPAAQKALDKIGAGLHLPVNYGLKSLTASASGYLDQMGTDVTIQPKWSSDKGFAVGVQLPKEFAQGMPPQQVTMFNQILARTFEFALMPLFLSPTEYAADYHLSHKIKDDQAVVEFLPYAETTKFERVQLFLDDDGRIELMVLLLRIDFEKDPPMITQFAGVSLECTFDYEKKGERDVIQHVGLLLGPLGEMTADVAYFELDGGTDVGGGDSTSKRYLPKTITINSAMQQAPADYAFRDYVLDGKPVPATAAKAVTPAAGDAGTKPAGDTKPGEDESGDEADDDTDDEAGADDGE